tara:strand:+ start:928 stop:1296 length:369 start_codon:yes stop_codon:yes gene_type:complete
MTRKQKKQIDNFVQSTLKIVGCSLLFLGLTMCLGVSLNPHMELYAYLMLFAGTMLIMTHSLRGKDHMYLLVSSAGFLLVSNAFLGTETAIMLADSYGIALTEEQTWFAKYGKLFVEILKAVA